MDLSAVNGNASGDAGVVNGEQLLAFTDAVMRGSDNDRKRLRAVLRALLTDAQLVDVAAVIAAFNVVDRIADASGIPLDEMMVAMSADVRSELNLRRFASSANTPGA